MDENIVFFVDWMKQKYEWAAIPVAPAKAGVTERGEACTTFYFPRTNKGAIALSRRSCAKRVQLGLGTHNIQRARRHSE